MRINQEREANRFMSVNKSEISETRGFVLRAAMRFLSGRSNALTPEDAAKAASAIVQADPLDLYRILRCNACQLRTGNDSTPYWDLIDALASFEDALSARWPYMTQVRRGYHLEWCREFSAKV